jgi:hypothetical protein
VGLKLGAFADVWTEEQDGYCRIVWAFQCRLWIVHKEPDLRWPLCVRYPGGARVILI